MAEDLVNWPQCLTGTVVQVPGWHRAILPVACRVLPCASEPEQPRLYRQAASGSPGQQRVRAMPVLPSWVLLGVAVRLQDRVRYLERSWGSVIYQGCRPGQQP